MCVGSWNDSNPYDPYNLPAGNQINYRPNTKLYISGEIPTEPEIKTQPLSLNFGEVEATVTKVLNIEVMNIGGGARLKLQVLISQTCTTQLSMLIFLYYWKWAEKVLISNLHLLIQVWKRVFLLLKLMLLYLVQR